MKTSAFILGVLGLFTFASCRCNLDEDESEKRKASKAAGTGKKAMNSPESDTLAIRSVQP